MADDSQDQVATVPAADALITSEGYKPLKPGRNMVISREVSASNPGDGLFARHEPHTSLQNHG